MKTMNKLFLMLLAMFALVACEDDGNDTKGAVLIGGTSTSQTVYADQSSSDNGIKFNASSSWTATVSPVTKSGNNESAWLTLSAYSGGAGDQTLTMTFKENTTGLDRKAEIKIVCGGTTITITVEQKGTTQGGEKPSSDVRLISKIAVTSNDDKDNTTKNVLFSYDGQNRLSEAKLTNSATSEARFFQKYTWKYEANAVTFVEERLDADTETSYTFTATGKYDLNADGTVKSMTKNAVSKENSSIKESYTTTETYTYTNGFLTKIYHKEVGDRHTDEGTRNFTWEGNNLVGETEDEDGWSSRHEYGGVYDKKCNIDLFEISRSGAEVFSVPVNSGKRSLGLLTKTTEFDGRNSYVYTYTYEYDSRGYITKINQVSGSEKIVIVITYND